MQIIEINNYLLFITYVISRKRIKNYSSYKKVTICILKNKKELDICVKVTNSYLIKKQLLKKK